MTIYKALRHISPTARILTCTELEGHCLFVLVSGYVC